VARVCSQTKNGNTVYKPTYLINYVPCPPKYVNNFHVIIIKSVRKGDGIM